MRAWRTTAFFLLATVAFAEEKPAANTAVVGSANEDGIAVAKREFDAVKSARGVRDSAKLDLGNLSTPELHMIGPAPQILKKPGESAAEAKKKKSANWLLDAMEEQKKKDSAAAGAPEKEPGENESEAEKLFATERDSSKPAEREIDKREVKKPAEAVVNPLDQYMAGWMTQQDFTLLKPTTSSEGANGIPSSRNDGSLTFGTGSTQASNPSDSSGPLKNISGGPASQSTSHENPFLAAFSPAPSLSTPAPQSVMVPPPSVGFQVPPSTVPAAKPLMPDFVKPRNDDKYYKQMKRF